MTGQPRPIRVILDASAIRDFTHGSVHVGETLAEVADDSGAAGLPILCLAQARWAITDTDRLDLLVNHHATTLLAPDPEDWQALAATYDIVGRLDAAAAVLAAIDHDCDVLTAQPGLYGGLAGGGPVIPI
ncbi:hypothetical protein ACNTMW_30895 [Planosporangium sp. 12N6]|uniref:hypothetical protein n=1 Tax=Planosporangium spinosum TaxID=3402278 RepID=UPI003CF930FC